jgi:hypothetical protein
VTSSFFGQCAIWNVPRLSPAQQQPLRSDIPTL